MGFCSNSGPFPCICKSDSDDENKMTELALLGKSESKHSIKKTNSTMLDLEVEDQGKLERMDNDGLPMLSNDNYHQWKENVKSNLMNHDVWYLLSNGYTKIPPPNEEVKKNSKALSDIINIIHDSTLNRVMHYGIAKKVWDNI